MGKWNVMKRVMAALVIVSAIVACEKKEPLLVNYVDLYPAIGEKGGIITGFNGDVVLIIPAGALDEPVKFKIEEWPGFRVSDVNDFLGTFAIEPFITFNVPVQLTVKCKGCLTNGKTLCDGMVASFYIWNNELEYLNQSGPCISCCCCEIPSQTITACIGITGIISTRVDGLQQ